MSVSKDFELVFEGPADESAETLRKLRTSLLADAGLSVTEAQEILSNTPKTVKTSQLEEDLKPLYAALKRAGGKVLIVRPAEATNEKAYFLDLEESQLDDDLLKSLEALPGDEERHVHEVDVAVDLTEALQDLAPEEENILTAEKPSAEPAPQEVPAVAPTQEKPAESTPAITAPELELGAEISLDVKVEPAPEPALPATESLLELSAAPLDPAPIVPPVEAPAASVADKPLFEFTTPLELPTPPTASAPSPTLELKNSAPLFEFSDDAKPIEPPVAATAPEPVLSAPKPPAPQTSILDDLTLSLDEPVTEEKPKVEKQAAKPKPTSIAHEEENTFSSDDLSSSLVSQLESEKAAAPKKADAPVAPALNLSVETESLPGAPIRGPSQEVAVPAARAPMQQPRATTNPNIVIEPEGAGQQALSSAAAEEPPPVAFKSQVVKEQISLDLLLPILVGAIILGVANWLYFKPDSDEIHLPTISMSENAQESDSEAAVRREVIPSTEKRVTGKTQQGALAISWTVLFDKEILKSVSIEGTTPQPPELTPEQIVRAERPQPWLYKIEVAQFPFEKQLDGTWQAKGPARVFVNQGPAKRRLVAQAEITLESFKIGEAVVGHFVISRGYPAPPAGETFHFEQLINGDIMLFVASDLK